MKGHLFFLYDWIYLILFAPPAFVPQRQLFLTTAFAFVLSANLLTFRRYTSPSVVSLITLALLVSRLRTLYTPSHCGEYSSLTSYRVCWHVSWTALTSRWSLSSVLLRCCCVRLSSIAQYSPLLPLLLSPTRVSV